MSCNNPDGIKTDLRTRSGLFVIVPYEQAVSLLELGLSNYQARVT